MKKVLLVIAISATAAVVATAVLIKSLPDYLFDPECWMTAD